MKQKTLVLFIIFGLFYNNLNAQKAVVKGIVQDDRGDPVEQAMVIVINSNIQTFTDRYGSFFLEVPTNTDLQIQFKQLSHRDTVLKLRLRPGETQHFTIVMPAIGEQLQTVDIRGKSDDGYIRIDPKLTFQMPSAGGGIESVIKMFPGAASNNELTSQYNIRGGNFDENLVFVNEIQIYRPFLMHNAQQEGLSFVNSDLTGNVKFSAGGFEAKYGDKMSSVLDVQYKEPVQYAGSLSAGLLGVSAHAEGRTDSCFSFLIGIRYKSNAYLFKSLETSGDYKPNFFDTQFLLKWDATKKFSISLLGNIARNRYLYRPKVRNTTFGSINEIKRITVYFDGQEVDRYENYLGGLTFSFAPNHNNLLKLILSSYYADESETYDIQSQYWLSDIIPDFGNAEGNIAQAVSTRAVGTCLEHARNQLNFIVSAADLRGTHRLPHSNTLSWGFKTQNEIIRDRIKEWTMTDSSGYTLPATHDSIGIITPLTDNRRLLTFGNDACLLSNNKLSTFRLSGFVQNVWKIGGDNLSFLLNTGLRFHYWTFNNEFTVSPRLAFSYVPHWKHDWEFSLKTGLYYQPAFYREMRRPDGTLNDKIKSQRSFQIIACTEYNFNWWRRPFKFTAEAYYKYLDRLILYTVDNIQIVYSGENNAIGYATGLDLKLSGEFIRGLESWFSVSLMKTAENPKNDNHYNDKGELLVDPGYIPRPTDQRVAFNVFFQDHIPGFPKFRVHLNFVFASGVPFMAPDGTSYNIVRRSPWYRRVDIGFSFMFLEQSRDRMRHHSKFVRSIRNAGIYIEAFNLLAINNVSSYSWITDTGGSQIAVPNYLTGRLLNMKFAIDF